MQRKRSLRIGRSGGGLSEFLYCLISLSGKPIASKSSELCTKSGCILPP